MVSKSRGPLARIAGGICDLVLVRSLDTFLVLLTLELAGLNELSIDSLLVVPFLTFLLLLNTGCGRADGGRGANNWQDGFRVASHRSQWWSGIDRSIVC